MFLRSSATALFIDSTGHSIWKIDYRPDCRGLQSVAAQMSGNSLWCESGDMIFLGAYLLQCYFPWQGELFVTSFFGVGTLSTRLEPTARHNVSCEVAFLQDILCLICQNGTSLKNIAFTVTHVTNHHTGSPKVATILRMITFFVHMEIDERMEKAVRMK